MSVQFAKPKPNPATQQRVSEVEAAIAELAQAIRLTREYVGADLLPAVDGWSWYDALRRHAPHELPASSAPTLPSSTSSATATTVPPDSPAVVIPAP